MNNMIIRQALKDALSAPSVHARLPLEDQTALTPILKKDVADWTPEEQQTCMYSFCWAEQHC